MEKLKVTLEDRPVDIELAQYKRMFEAACSALAAIGDALGVDPEEGGAEPILAAIADLKASDSRPVKQEPVYFVHFTGDFWVETTKEKYDTTRWNLRKKLYAAQVDAKAIRAEALEEAEEIAKTIGGIFAEEFLAAIRGLR